MRTLFSPARQGSGRPVDLLTFFQDTISGNDMIKPKKQKKIKQTAKTPPTEISRTPKSIYVRCLLNGISEEKIRIDLEHNRLTISAANDDEIILKKIKVPSGSYISSKKFHEGVLEILLER